MNTHIRTKVKNLAFVTIVEKYTRISICFTHLFFRTSKYFYKHQLICKPFKKTEAHKAKLKNCYVLIEPLEVPNPEFFHFITSSEEALNVLQLNEQPKPEKKTKQTSVEEESEEILQFKSKTILKSLLYNLRKKVI